MTRKSKVIKQAITSQIISDELTAIGMMDFDGLEQTVKAVYNAFPENFVHTFAVKANPLVKVLEHLRYCGMGAEVASPGELKIALAAGFNVEDVIFDSPTKTIADLTTCIKNNISINIDNLQELARIDKIIEQYPDSTSVIGFRINPQIGGGKISSTSTATATSKFGYALKDGDNRQRLIDIYKQRPWLHSIHNHTGSQGCSLELMAKGVAVIMALAEEINGQLIEQQITRLDIGGGLAVNFSSDDITPTFQDYADVLKTEVPLLFTTKYQVKTEFGRAIAAKNGFIITRVEYTKFSGGRHIVATHVGAQIATRTTFLPKSWPLRVTGYSPEGEERVSIKENNVGTDISGPCCFAGDLIAVDVELPLLSPNDYVIVHDTGAYYFTSHFDYNCLPRVAVYSVSNGEIAEQGKALVINCIRQSESLDDVLSKMQ